MFEVYELATNFFNKLQERAIMEIKEIKDRLGIEELVRHYGYEPTVKGLLICPFCGDATKPRKKKTFTIYVDTNRFKCFHTKCEQEYGRGDGDIFDFIERQEKTTKGESIKIAKKILGVSTDTSSDARSEEGQQLKKSEEQDLCSSASSVSQAVVFSAENPSELYYKRGTLEITVLGGINIFSGLDRLKATLEIRKVGEYAQLCQGLNLLDDEQISKLSKKIAERLELSTSNTQKNLYELSNLLRAYRLEERKRRTEEEKLPPLTVSEQDEALNFLKEEELMQRTNDHIGKSGIVGEELNRLILWLVYSSRKRRKPLHAICLSASGTGKTYLQDSISKFVPKDEKYSFTASTENAFYYLQEDELKNKLVIIEDLDGANNVLYSLRELQTKQSITRAVPVSENLGDDRRTKTLRVNGPICFSSTTTKESVYEDNANRCLLLYLDNSKIQDKAIMDYQRKQSAGKIDEIEEYIITKQLTNVQRVLEEVKVINPYAEQLEIPERSLKPLRTNAHYLDFIETVTYYHQYQRTRKVNQDTGEEYIETTLEDIRIANELIKPILLDKSDELPNALRSFFERLKQHLKKEKQESFYGKDIRENLGLYPMQLHRHLTNLEQYSLIKKIGGNKKKGFEYQVSDWTDYTKLKEGLTVLDSLLADLEKRKSH